MRPPSLVRPRTFISVFDSAVNRPGDDATPDERKTFADALERARDTGDYADLLKTGQVPTRFVLQPIRESVLLKVIDAGLSENLLNMTLFRIAVVDIVVDGQSLGLGKRVEDERFGSLLPESVIDDLGAAYRMHVMDVAGDAFRRALEVSPKP